MWHNLKAEFAYAKVAVAVSYFVSAIFIGLVCLSVWAFAKRHSYIA